MPLSNCRACRNTPPISQIPLGACATDFCALSCSKGAPASKLSRVLDAVEYSQLHSIVHDPVPPLQISDWHASLVALRTFRSSFYLPPPRACPKMGRNSKN